MAKKTKKEILFGLYDKGFDYTSPEIKELGFVRSTAKHAYVDWKKARGLVGDVRDGTKTGKKGSTYVNLPGGEGISTVAVSQPLEPEVLPPEPETPQEPPPSDLPPEEPEELEPADDEGNGHKEPEEELKGDQVALEPGDDGHKPTKPKGLPDKVIGMGIPVNVILSIKTLALWEYAREIQRRHGEDLPLGDFIDTTVEDFYRGRGKDLGLVRIAGGK